MNILAGLGLVCLGVAVLFLGDKKLKIKDGTALRFLSPSTRWHKTSAKLQKWVVALLLVWFGLG